MPPTAFRYWSPWLVWSARDSLALGRQRQCFNYAKDESHQINRWNPKTKRPLRLRWFILYRIHIMPDCEANEAVRIELILQSCPALSEVKYNSQYNRNWVCFPQNIPLYIPLFLWTACPAMQSCKRSRARRWYRTPGHTKRNQKHVSYPLMHLSGLGIGNTAP